MTAALVAVPAVAGLAAFGIRSNAGRRALLVAAALAHAVLTAWSWRAPATAAAGWLEFDELGRFFLSITSGLFLAAAFYAVGYLRREAPGEQTDPEEGFLFTDVPERVFTGCLLLFLAMMTLVTASQHFGLLWVAVEATTLASAPLIYFHRHHRSLEATWKYLLICSVGIALALLGNFLLTAAAARLGQHDESLLLGALMKDARLVDHGWLKAAFIFFLVGYGTKMGLAPLHTWLPDAHSEAPSPVSALLSGALLNTALLAILRAHQVCVAAGLASFSSDLLVLFGLLSMAVAAVFILNQPDYKRMLAYSSVEHMGILALGVGLGGGAVYGAVLHALNHSLTKGFLFLVAGNVLAAYRTKTAADVRGLIRALPASGLLWLAGFFAITGSPPFGTFLSELAVLKGAIEQGHPAIAAAYLGLLALVFIGMASVFLRMAQGKPPANMARVAREGRLSILPPAVLAAAVLVLGVYVPSSLSAVLQRLAGVLGGTP
ncbi:MAG: NADH dehydrogenase FAD-containing subunit [Kiritimatiellae bacterium]|nr:NADH dehydrogenase FAD-containing subunit [Kiritimatiellia bacterium]